MRMPCRSGFRPTGPSGTQQLQRKENSYRIENPTRRRLLRIFSSNGRRQGQTDICSSRLGTVEMVPGKATFAC